MDVSLVSNVKAPDAIAHCAFRLTHDSIITLAIPPINAFYIYMIHLRLKFYKNNIKSIIFCTYISINPR